MSIKTIAWKQPVSVPQAVERRQKLVSKMVELQHQLARRREKTDEYFRWKEGVLSEVREIQKELSLLKAWLRENHNELSANRAIAFLRSGMNEVCQYIQSLITYSDNLRRRLEKYESDIPDAPSMPPFDKDWWREQT